jgi:hypothetical protein
MCNAANWQLKPTDSSGEAEIRELPAARSVAAAWTCTKIVVPNDSAVLAETLIPAHTAVYLCVTAETGGSTPLTRSATVNMAAFTPQQP